MKRKRIIIMLAAVLAIGTVGTQIIFAENESNSQWGKYSDGHVKAVHTDETSVVDVVSPYVSPSKLTKAKENIYSKTVGKVTIKEIKKNGKLLSGEYKNGKLINQDNEGKGFIVEDSKGTVINEFYDYFELKYKQHKLERKVEDSEMVVNDIIAAGPQWTKSGIVYRSNIDSIDGRSSIWLISEDGKRDVKFVDASNFGSLSVVGTYEDTIVLHLEDRFAFGTYKVAEQSFYEYPNVKGVPVSLSPNGKYLLYQRLIGESSLRSNLSVLNLLTGETQDLKVDEDFFYNKGGAWDKSGEHFAYVALGKHNNDPTKLYRSNSKLQIVNMFDFSLQISSVPKGEVIYSPGEISWLDENTLLTPTEDESGELETWSYKLNRGEQK